MEIDFKVNSDQVGKELIAAMNKTILNDTFTKKIENAAYDMVKDFDKSIKDSMKWTIENLVGEILDSEEFKPKLVQAIREQLNDKLPAYAAECIDKISIRNY